jgi:WD repeat-containing protein 19
MKLLFEIPHDAGTSQSLFSWQSALGNYLAVGGVKQVTIHNRQGLIVDTIRLPGTCTSLDWNKDGEHLSITHDFNGSIFLWNSNTRSVSLVETGIKEGISLGLWAKHSSLLALCTTKGNLMLYNHRIKRKIPVIGKHGKNITCGVWSHQNVLALSGEDKKITFTDQDGNSIAQKDVKFELHSLAFSPDGLMLIAIAGSKVLYLFEIVENGQQLELIFEAQYGDITSLCWHGNDKIMLGFSKGFMIMISRTRDELGRELYQSHNFKGRLTDISVAPSAPLIAASSNNQIKLHEVTNLEGMYGMFQMEDKKGVISSIKWTDDSQLLTASIHNGAIMTFLVQLPQLGDCYDTSIGYLSSLLQVNVVQVNSSQDGLMTIDCPIEPAFVSVGLSHVAIGMNNRIWFTEIMTDNRSFTERSYTGTISDVKLNDRYAAVLSDGRIELHLIQMSLALQFNAQPMSDRPDVQVFPYDGDSDVITCLGLTNNFLIYGTEAGNIVYFCLEEWSISVNFKHVIGITHLYPDCAGIRVIIIDDKSDVYLYNPITDSLLELNDIFPSIKGIVWESFPNDKYIFTCYDKDNIATYVYYNDTVNGSYCMQCGVTQLPFGYKPVHLYQGELSCLTLTGKLDVIRLNSHFYSDSLELSDEELRASFNKSLLLKKIKDSWAFATALDSEDCWQQLISASLHHFDIKSALYASQQVRDVSMVYSLRQIESIEDRNAVAGYISLYNKDYVKAQRLFLESSQPITALEMHCDILQWDQAIELARTLATDRIPTLSRQYAQQLEFVGDYGNALINYEKGITNDVKFKAHDELCVAGLARTSLYTGDMKRGVKLAQASLDVNLKKECAVILENLKLYGDAGSLFEQAECWEEATNAFIKTKNWNKVGVLLSKLPQASKLQGQYAKAREADGNYHEAALAYEKAMDYINATRIYLDCLKSPDEAVRVVNESQSTEGAKLVAKFFQKIGDYSSALQFLVLSNCNDEAFNMAESHGQMNQYADVLGDNASIEDYLKIAYHYEKTNDIFKAGVFFMKAREYKKALDYLLSCPMSLFPEGDHIDMAIKVVGQAKLESLTSQLYSYLMGEMDNEPKEARFLFAMYMSLGVYHKAAQSAILIAKEDQLAGNYRNARDTLYRMYNELVEHKIKIPNEMKQNLMLLHSYLLVKLQVRLGAHDKAAHLLVRVAGNISKFPSHVVQILTSTVIECQRVGLKNSAFTYAAMLMKPEYRSEVDPKWKKKLESIVRKPDKSEVEDVLTPCHVCSFMIPQMKLDCPQCKNNLSYCIVTGRHMVKNDWCECYHCHFPALYSEFKM